MDETDITASHFFCNCAVALIKTNCNFRWLRKFKDPPVATDFTIHVVQFIPEDGSSIFLRNVDDIPETNETHTTSI
jgi:hypothetical protein